MPEFQLGLAEAEILLGVWLLTGYLPVLSWIVVTITFIAFAGVSLNNGIIGETSCGCTGRIPLNPWQAFEVDLAVLAVLLVAHPDLGSVRSNPRAFVRRSALVGTVALGGVFASVGLLAVSGHFISGSIEAMLAHLRGEHLSVYPRVVDVGAIPASKERELSVELVNRTDHAVCIFGGTSDCSCTVLADLPLRLASGERRRVRILTKMPRKPGLFTRHVTLLFDDEGFRKTSVMLTGRSLASNGDDGALQASDRSP